MTPMPPLRALQTALILATMAGGLPPAHADAQTAAPTLVSRVYQVRHIDPDDALMLAKQICLSRNGDDNLCRHAVERRGWFTYNTDAETQDAIAAALAAADVPSSSLNLQLTLLMADNEPRPDPELAQGEAQALADLRQILPYKSYRLVESGWLRISDRGQLRLGGSPPYIAEVDLDRALTGSDSSLGVRRFELTRERVLPGGPEGPRYDMQRLLASSFSMSVGETVVVGTSRLNGDDEALVVLLTATR